MMSRAQRWADRQQTPDRLCSRLLPCLAASARADGLGTVRVIDLARTIGATSRATREHLRHLTAAGLLSFDDATAGGIAPMSVHAPGIFWLHIAAPAAPQRAAL
jgi:preprotein translocase subunit Sec61beta